MVERILYRGQIDIHTSFIYDLTTAGSGAVHRAVSPRQNVAHGLDVIDDVKLSKVQPINIDRDVVRFGRL